MNYTDDIKEPQLPAIQFNHFPIQIIANSMNESDFFDFCQQNDVFLIEREANGVINIMEPLSGEDGYFEAEANGVLNKWAKENVDKKGLTFSPSVGFTLKSGAVKSPDASWLSIEKWRTIPSNDRKKFPHICPDFVIEVRSENDRLPKLKKKMEEWIDNGVQLAWLIDPSKKMSYIYRADGSTETIEGFDKKLSGENILKGFELDLSLFVLPENML